MTPPRKPLAVLLVAALAISAAAIALLLPGEQVAPPDPANSPANPGAADSSPELLAALQAHDHTHGHGIPKSRREILKGEHAKGELPEPPAYQRLIDREKVQAFKAVRRFHEAFSLYEIGKLSRAVRRDLEIHSAPGLAATLLAEPPRLPALATPDRARLIGQLEFVPRSTTGREQLLEADVVGQLLRGTQGRPEPISFRVTRSSPGANWLVERLGAG